MVEPRLFRFDTLALHAGQSPDPLSGARAVPIYQTTSYVFPDPESAASLFNLEIPGHLDARFSNPTVAAFEERVAALEGGVAAVATASGQAALHLAIATLMGAGAHIVAARNLSRGFVGLLHLTLPRFGIETSFVDPRDPAAFAAAIRPETRLVVAATLGELRLEVLDIPRVAEIAHAHSLPLLIDNTLATPSLCRPFELGADLVLHSATKWLGGHGVAVGGVLVDGGRFDWQASKKFPTLTEPDPGYAGLVFADSYGPLAFALRARSEGLRNFGACISPQHAFYLLLGLETLSLRIGRHVENTARVLAFLKQHPAIAWLMHPALPDHPDHARAQQILPKGQGAILTFGLKGGRAAASRFLAACRLASHVASVGEAKTLITHPASTTYRHFAPAQLQAFGVSEEMIQLSVGLEDPEDIIADLDRALRAAQRGD